MQLNVFQGIFDSSLTTSISLLQFLLCIAVALGTGFVLSLAYAYKNHASKSFLVTLATLPAVVCVVIMMVNGNVGAGVAVAGAFSLVRFRSVPGTAREIGIIFVAMGTGLMMGMGYLGFAVLFALIICAVNMMYHYSGFGERKNISDKIMTITIPEDLNYTHIFEDLMVRYTSAHKIANVKTTNMGSLFKVSYHVTLKDNDLEKEFIDALRCRNGNLEIVVSPLQANANEL